MQNMKHVGRLANNRKAIVAFRVIPNDPTNCLVIMTESLEAGDHDTLINLVESTTGQSEYELGSAMMRTKLPDGSNMLARFSQTGKLMKTETSGITMTPNFQTTINLAELNQIMADQKGITIADLAIKDPNGATAPVSNVSDEPVPSAQAAASYTNTTSAMDEAVTTTDTVLTDDVLAAQYRSQADSLYKEAKALRAQAEELVPTVKKTAVKKTKASA
tara:strand:+ start:5997 stop:6650 length:654 start_codon:yes stop_codon:yes gene_type:complete